MRVRSALASDCIRVKLKWMVGVHLPEKVAKDATEGILLLLLIDAFFAAAVIFPARVRIRQHLIGCRNICKFVNGGRIVRILIRVPFE